jgi:hypothetical protein
VSTAKVVLSVVTSGATAVESVVVVESVEVESPHDVMIAAKAIIARNFFICFFLKLIIKYFYIRYNEKGNPAL